MKRSTVRHSVADQLERLGAMRLRQGRRETDPRPAACSRPAASARGAAAAPGSMSSEFGRWMTSGGGSLASHSSSFSNSFRCKPSSPFSIEIVSSPSNRGSVEIDPDDAALMSHGASSSRSRMRGVRRKKPRALLQVDADAAEEHALFADVRLVGQRRRVERHEQRRRGRAPSARQRARCRASSCRNTSPPRPR